MVREAPIVDAARASFIPETRIEIPARRTSSLLSIASRRRSPSVSRSRCFPSRSNSAVFSAHWYSITLA